MKKFVFILFMVVSVLANAQETVSFTPYKHNFNVGVGSNLYGIITNRFVKGDLVDRAYATPIFHVTYSYQALTNLYVGVGFNYQYFYFSLLPLDSTHNALVATINRTNLNLHVDWYVVHQQNYNIFIGGQGGVTFWSGSLTFSQIIDYVNQIIPFPFIANQIVKNLVPSDIKFFDYSFSLQLNAGFNKYFTPNFGLHGELAIGAPYWAEIGLTYRFGQNKL